jgi:hypothetical protein
VSERFFIYICWYEIISSIEWKRKISPQGYFFQGVLTTGRSTDLIDDVGFGIVFGSEFFEPAILEWGEYLHRDNFFGFDEEIIVV